MNTQRASLTPSASPVSSARTEPPTKVDQIHALMADRCPRAPSEVANMLGFDAKLVSDYLRQYSCPGPSQRYHTVDHWGARNAARYVLGAGENVGRRRALDPHSDADDAALNERFRQEPRNWPTVDVVLLNSMNAMVRMGVPA